MNKLSTSIEPDCENLALPRQHCNMLIASSYLHHVHVVKKADLSWRIPLLSIS